MKCVYLLRKMGGVAAVVLACLVLPSCASAGGNRKGTCPVPDGVKCMSLAEVYARTNGAESRVAPVQPALMQPDRQPQAQEQKPVAVQQAQTAVPRRPVAYQPVTYAQAVRKGETLAVVVPGGYATNEAVPQPPSQEVPKRSDAVGLNASAPQLTPAKVMRIFVAAWEDESGALHMPSYIYAEVEPKRWSVGHVAPAAVRDDLGFRLLEGLGGNREAQPANKGANATAGRAPTGMNN